MSYYSLRSLAQLCLDSLTRGDLPASGPALEDLATLPGHLKVYQPCFVQYSLRQCCVLQDSLLRVLVKRGVNPAQLSALLHRGTVHLDLSDTALCPAHLTTVAATCSALHHLNLTSGRTFLKRGAGTRQGAGRGRGEGIACREATEAVLGRNQRLTGLQLAGLDWVTDTLLSHLPSSLTSLDLTGCPALTDEGVAAVGRRCPNLTSLSLARCKVTDTGLASLGRAELAATLLELRLDGCRAITDQGVEQLLAGCSALQILLLHRCPGVTEQAREQLEQHLARAGQAVKQLSWTVY